MRNRDRKGRAVTVSFLYLILFDSIQTAITANTHSSTLTSTRYPQHANRDLRFRHDRNKLPERFFLYHRRECTRDISLRLTHAARETRLRCRKLRQRGMFPKG